jgi:hypothetical protein
MAAQAGRRERKVCKNELFITLLAVVAACATVVCGEGDEQGLAAIIANSISSARRG